MSGKSIDLKTVRTSRLMGELERRVSPDRKVLQQARRKAFEILEEAEAKRRQALLEADSARSRVKMAEGRLKSLARRLRTLETYQARLPVSMIELAPLIGNREAYAYEAHLAMLVLLRRAGGSLELPADSQEFVYRHDERVKVSVKGDGEAKLVRIELVKR